VPALLLLGAIAVGGSFQPSAAPVRYASLLPHLTLNLFFFGFTALALAAMAVGLVRAWRAWRGESFWQPRPWLFVRAFFGAAFEILTHRRFGDCEQRRWKRWAHLGLFYGFAGLFVLTCIVVVLLLTGAPYPLPFRHPLKIVGNVFAFLLVAGGLYALVERWVDTRDGDLSTPFDWLFLLDVLFVGLTGILAEVLRFAELPWVAYPVYVLHLVFVFPLLVLLPYTKFAHMAYRTLAVAGRRYDRLCRRRERGAIVEEHLPAPPGWGPSPGEAR
jgi:quinone-modifying oxidoreductase subunit QmoC